MRKSRISSMLLLVPIIFMLVGLANAQEEETSKGRIFFSTEEDFVTRGPEPPDGNPIISDGDLLTPGTVYMRNSELLAKFQVDFDLGLDAADVIDVRRRLVAFSTELDHPKGLFTAGDLLATNGAILPNAALLAAFNLPPELDLGLDAIHFMGKQEAVIDFLEKVKDQGRDFWLEEPKRLIERLEESGINIWFSTEGTAPVPRRPRFLDGDLLSAADGSIVAPNAILLPPIVPAGIPDRGVDFGLDAYTAPTRDYETARERGLFSTEILFEERPDFTDGDVLAFGNGVVITNSSLVHPFEPEAEFLGLDALSLFIGGPPDRCDAEIIQVGGMAAGKINSNGLANGWNVNSVWKAFDSPFGQQVDILGAPPACEGCERFKVEYAEWPNPVTPPAPSAFNPLTGSFSEETKFMNNSILVSRTPDPDGWLDILPIKICNPNNYTIMGGLYFPWKTDIGVDAVSDGKYSLRLTIEDAGGGEHVSPPVVVVIDNTKPDALLTIDTYPQCGDIIVGDTLTGTITATDKHFYVYRLRYLSTANTGFILPDTFYTSVSDTGVTNLPFTWNTTGLPPCGYCILLEVWDRTIRNNMRFGWYGWYSYDADYFCLKE